MYSEQNKHLFKCINIIMITTRRETLLDPPEACLYRSCALDRKNKPQTKLRDGVLHWAQSGFLTWVNPCPSPVPYMLAELLCFTLIHSKEKHKTVIEIVSHTVELSSAQVWLKHLWEQGLQRIQWNLSKEKNLSILFNYSKMRKEHHFQRNKCCTRHAL